MMAVWWSAVATLTVYVVDPQAALEASAAGAKLQAELRAEVSNVQRTMIQRQERLLARRAQLTPEAFEAERSALNQQIDAAERRLDARQTKVLAPLLKRLDAVMADLSRGAVVVEAEPRWVAGSPEACDLTSWVAARLDGLEARRPDVATCRTQGLVVVERGPAVQGTPVAQRIVSARDEYRTRQQARLRTLEQTGGNAGEALRIQRQVERRDRQAQDALAQAVQRALVTSHRSGPSCVWVALEDPGPLRARSCPGTATVRGKLMGQEAPPVPAGCDCGVAPQE